MVIEVTQGPGFEVEQGDPALLVVHGEHLHRPLLAVGAPPGAVHHGVLLDAVLDPADLDVLGADARVHRHDAHPPRRERLAHLGAGILLGGLPALVHELHETRALRVGGVLPGAEDEVSAIGGGADVHYLFALRHRNLLGQQSVVVPAELVPAFVAFLAFADDLDQFVLLGLEPRLLVRLLVLRRNRDCELTGRARRNVVFPEISAFVGVGGEALGREEHLAAVRTQPQLPDPAGDRKDGTDSPIRRPHVERALGTPRRGISGDGTNRIRAGNEANLVVGQFTEGSPLAVHREPGIVVGKLLRLRVLPPAEIDLLPVGRPSQVAWRQPEDPASTAEVVERQPEARIGVRDGELRLGAELRSGECRDKQDKGYQGGGGSTHAGLLQRISRIRSLAG